MALPAAARSTAQTTWVYDCKNRQKMNSADQKSMMPSNLLLSAKLRLCLWYMLALTLFARLIAMAVLPLTDATESRYGEIARKMLETANWMTPQYSYGVPFWGKPPLSTWLSAASMGVFGVNELAVRLPALILGLGVLWLVWHLGTNRHNRDFSLLSITTLSSLPLFFIASGAVMTDASLAFSTCLSFAAFWLALSATDNRKRIFWGYLFFAGQGLGLLAKGPVCGVLSLPPILLWTLTNGNQWRLLWNRLPWIKGTLLMLCIAAPWYILAEHRTPGFFAYFIIGEHLGRFLVTGWGGDKYGHAHQAPLGMIWVYWIIDVLPWSLIAVTWATQRLRSLKILFQDTDGWTLYLLWWALWPMLFFSLAHNILWTYTLTGLPAFALLLVEMWHRSLQGKGHNADLPYRHRFWLLFTGPALAALVASLLLVSPLSFVQETTQKFLAQKYLALRPSADSQLYYLFDRYYSAEFYTGGQAHHTDNFDDIRKLLANHSRDFLAVNARDAGKIPDDIIKHFQKVGKSGEILLLEENISESD